MSIKLNLNNETGILKSVIVGIANDRGKVKHKNNPKYAELVEKGEDPDEPILVSEVENFVLLLEKHGVKVYRPDNIPNCGQIFTRDIGFVIDDTFVYAKMFHENRRIEQPAINALTKNIEKVLFPPENALIEGGDIVLWGNYVFVGLGERTNAVGVNFLQENFKNKKVIPLKIRVTDEGKSNVLHLDCAFQPIGENCAIIYEDGFEEEPNVIYELFEDDKLIKVTQNEMYEMFPNIFSISPDTIMVEEKFYRLIDELEKRNFQVEKVCYGNVSKLGGLLRCSTLPLNRT